MEGEEEEGMASCETWLEAAQAVRQRVKAAQALQRRIEAAQATRQKAEAVVVARRTTAAEAVTAGQGGPLEVRAEAEGNNMAVLARDKAGSS